MHMSIIHINASQYSSALNRGSPAILNLFLSEPCRIWEFEDCFFCFDVQDNVLLMFTLLKLPTLLYKPSINLSDIFHWANIAVSSSKEVVDHRQEDDCSIDHDSPVHGCGSGVR